MVVWHACLTRTVCRRSGCGSRTPLDAYDTHVILSLQEKIWLIILFILVCMMCECGVDLDREVMESECESRDRTTKLDRRVIGQPFVATLALNLDRPKSPLGTHLEERFQIIVVSIPRGDLSATWLDLFFLGPE